MTARDFCYWLQGKLEIDDAEHGDGYGTVKSLSAAQVKVIKKHLAMVFAHDIDPKAGSPDLQKVLDGLHGTGLTSLPGDIVVRC